MCEIGNEFLENLLLLTRGNSEENVAANERPATEADEPTRALVE